MRVIDIIIFFNFNNMENIIEPTESFDFSKITLTHPIGIQGGAYFTKIEYNKKPLYIQTTKSQTRQGIIKTGKKYYSDLMFDKNSETLINWFENLEEKCKKLIYEKREAWFQGSLEENDIDSAFNSILRVYKSGKYYLVRINIRSNKDETPMIKIYNEQEIPLTANDITPETNIISILEIQGIKFTSRNFQIEIDLKQIMVLNNEPLFESCLIKTNKNHLASLEKEKQKEIEIPLNEIDEKINDFIKLDNMNKGTINQNDNQSNDILENIDNSLEEFEPLNLLENGNKMNDNKINDNKMDDNKMDDNKMNDNKMNDNKINNNKNEEDIILEIEDLNEDINENNDDLREINNNELHLDKSQDSITLKKPNQVYFELYKEARKKAKQAKKNAILAYLEAKNIKKTYLIENIDDSDSEFDAEIDDISESELDGL